MKVALVHELLTLKGGAERVLRIFTEMFPDAPIYTLLYDKGKLGDWFPPERVRPSRLQKIANRWPLSASRFNHHLYLPSFPGAVEAWDFSAFDLVLSSSSAFTHGIITNGKPKHLSYIHSPARYLWDRTHDVLDRTNRGFFGPLKRAVLSRVLHPLRTWDAEAADRADGLIAASHEVQRRIQLYWRRESEVIHPPIDDYWFTPISYNLSSTPYYLIASTLSAYKRIDLAIDACNQLNRRLKIAGTGSAEQSLRAIAGPTIEFLGFQPDHDLKELYTNARAVIFPGEEDFGLVPLEANACGTPVIAYRAGGALETIHEGENGMFFPDATSQSLVQAILRFEQKKYSNEKCIEVAQKYRKGMFVQKMYATVEELMKEN